MVNRVSGRSPAFLLSALCAALFTTSGADAALKKYELGTGTLAHFFQSSPRADFRSSANTGVALIDQSGVSPILKKLIYGVLPGQGGSTILVPSLEGFIFIKGASLTGPTENQIGTGATASSINWGNTDGWTITGGEFCHSIPSNICAFAGRVIDGTGDPPFISENYDMGTWTFHGTGFVADGAFITFTNTAGAAGNAQTRLRGQIDTDGSVPAIPLLGMGAVGVSVIALGMAAMRRR